MNPVKPDMWYNYELYIMNVFTITSDQLNASLFNKSINLFEKNYFSMDELKKIPADYFQYLFIYL